MALINCPECGKEVSDRAKVCPQCGKMLYDENATVTEEKKYCADCGLEIPPDAVVCPNCGCPVTDNDDGIEMPTPQKVELTKISIPLFKKKSFWITVVSCILVIICCIWGVKYYQSNQAKKYAEQYYSNMESASSTMLLGASSAESAGNLIHDVWYNAIYDKYDSETSKYTRGASDFNDALANLFKDEDFKKKIEFIKNNQDSVNNYMKELKNPPEQYKDIYEDLKEYYDAYIEFTNLVIDPTGSLTTFTSNFNDSDSKTVNCYKKMQLNLSE